MVFGIYIMNAFNLIEQINLQREKMKAGLRGFISYCKDQDDDCAADVRQLIQDIIFKSDRIIPDTQHPVRHTLTVFKNLIGGRKDEIGTLVFYDSQ